MSVSVKIRKRWREGTTTQFSVKIQSEDGGKTQVAHLREGSQVQIVYRWAVEDPTRLEVWDAHSRLGRIHAIGEQPASFSRLGNLVQWAEDTAGAECFDVFYANSWWDSIREVIHGAVFGIVPLPLLFIPETSRMGVRAPHDPRPFLHLSLSRCGIWSQIRARFTRPSFADHAGPLLLPSLLALALFRKAA